MYLNINEITIKYYAFTHTQTHMYRYIISFALGSSCPSQPLIQVDTSFVQAQPNLQIKLLQPLKDQVGFKLG